MYACTKADVPVKAGMPHPLSAFTYDMKFIRDEAAFTWALKEQIWKRFKFSPNTRQCADFQGFDLQFSEGRAVRLKLEEGPCDRQALYKGRGKLDLVQKGRFNKISISQRSNLFPSIYFDLCTPGEPGA